MSSLQADDKLVLGLSSYPGSYFSLRYSLLVSLPVHLLFTSKAKFRAYLDSIQLSFCPEYLLSEYCPPTSLQPPWGCLKVIALSSSSSHVCILYMWHSASQVGLCFSKWLWSSRISVTWTLWEEESQAPPRPGKSESSTEQDTWVILIHGRIQV